MYYLEDIFEVLNLARPFRNRIIRERINPMEFYTDDEFLQRYRLSKASVRMLVEDLGEGLATQRLSSTLRLLLALRVLTHGCFQITASDVIHVDQSTCSRALHDFLEALLARRQRYICFPANLASVKREFHRLAGFPGVIGCVDGTHVEIMRPPNDPNSDCFFNRKRRLTINVQVVAGPDLKLYDVIARWPGSTHDSRVFKNSALKARLENGDLHNSGQLLGDKDTLVSLT